MKKEIISIFILAILVFLLFSSFSYSYEYVNITGGSCAGKVESWSKMVAAQGGDCTNFASIDLAESTAQSYLNSHAWGADCGVGLDYDTVTPNCAIVKAIVCCTQERDNLISNAQRTVGSSGTVTGVPIGGEPDAAKTYAENAWSSMTYPEIEGKTRTDGALGYSYTSSAAADGTTSNVEVVAWKRAVYTKAGDSAVPLSDLGDVGSGGSGGQSVSETTGAVRDGLDTSSRIGAIRDNTEDTAMGVSDVRDAVENVQYAIEGLSLGGVIVDNSDILSALNPPGTPGFTAPLAPAADEFLLSSVDLVSLKNDFTSSVSSSVNVFTVDAKATGLGGLIGSFFGSMPSTVGTPPVLTWDAGERFGTHEIDFATYTSFFAILKTLVIFVCTFISIRNIFLKGGSG